MMQNIVAGDAHDADPAPRPARVRRLRAPSTAPKRGVRLRHG